MKTQTWQEQDSYKDLFRDRKNLVPFIGAGFSVPDCPTWWNFLEKFKEEIVEDFLLPEDVDQLKQLENNSLAEDYADLLIDRAGRGKTNILLAKIFGIDKPSLNIKGRFDALHNAFDGLKVTTNFDSLLENTSQIAPYKIHGNNPEELGNAFTRNLTNAVLKIHGGLDNPSSIILTKRQYEKAYGTDGFDNNLPLPKFLCRVFQNQSILFIGCSLGEDRTMKVLKSIGTVRPHYALMRYESDKTKRVDLNRRLSNLQIQPVWIDDFRQITDFLNSLCSVPVENSKVAYYKILGEAIKKIQERISLMIKLIKLPLLSTEVEEDLARIDGKIQKCRNSSNVGPIEERLLASNMLKNLVNERYNIQSKWFSKTNREVEHLEQEAKRYFENFLKTNNQASFMSCALGELSQSVLSSIKVLQLSCIQLADLKPFLDAASQTDASQINREIELLRPQLGKGNVGQCLNAIFKMSNLVFLRYKAQRKEINKDTLSKCELERNKVVQQINTHIEGLNKYKDEMEIYNRKKDTTNQLNSFLDDLKKFANED